MCTKNPLFTCARRTHYSHVHEELIIGAWWPEWAETQVITLSLLYMQTFASVTGLCKTITSRRLWSETAQSLIGLFYRCVWFSPLVQLTMAANARTWRVVTIDTHLRAHSASDSEEVCSRVDSVSLLNDRFRWVNLLTSLLWADLFTREPTRCETTRRIWRVTHSESIHRRTHSECSLTDSPTGCFSCMCYHGVFGAA